VDRIITAKFICLVLVFGCSISNLALAQVTAPAQATEVANDSATVVMKDFSGETKAEKAEKTSQGLASGFSVELKFPPRTTNL